jgi:hypothetical protein
LPLPVSNRPGCLRLNNQAGRRVNRTGNGMKTILVLVLAGAAGLGPGSARAQEATETTPEAGAADSATVTTPAEAAVDYSQAVVYRAPVTYEAPVVYRAPVIYEVPVVYQGQPAYAASTPAYAGPTPPIIISETQYPRVPNVIYVGYGGVSYQYYDAHTTPTVIYFGRGEAYQRGYNFWRYR